jgi:hypothetical protein
VLQWLAGDDDEPQHPYTGSWEHFYRRPIPGATRAEQRKAVQGWQDRLSKDEAAKNTVAYGTSRPSALELAIGAEDDGSDAWKSAVAAALGWFTGENAWVWAHLLPIGSES